MTQPTAAARLPAAELGTPLPVPLEGGALRGLMSWTKSLGAGSVGFDSISRNFTNISEKDCNSKRYKGTVCAGNSILQHFGAASAR